MAENNNTDLNKELKESIAYFEQILDVLPGERTALEFLCVACSQLGDQEKFLKYAIQLTDVVLREENAEGAADLVEKLSGYEDPRAKQAVLKLQVLAAPRPVLKFEKADDRVSSAAPAVAAKAELALLDRLVAEGVLARNLVQTAYDQLETLPTTGGAFLISALAILEKENISGAADAVIAVADAALAPPVPLDMFDLNPADVRRLPERLIRVRGAVPFARIGGEWAVAVLNPLDEELRREIAAELEAKCHFFLLPPLVIDVVMKKIFQDDVPETQGATAPKPVAPRPEPAPQKPAAVEEPVAEEAGAAPRRAKLGIRRPGK